MRTERDFLGTMQIDDGALYGIHSMRALANFPDRTRFHEEWYRAIGMVKLACYKTYAKFSTAVRKNSAEKSLAIPLMDDRVVEALSLAAGDVALGKHFDHFIVPAISGGAGTSINMNVNEIITNAALMQLGSKPGDYATIDPIDGANVFQSTNDVIPTSLKVATLKLLTGLEAEINRLRACTEKLESEHQGSMRIAYTQMQAAVPSSYGKLFGAYSEALSRDWWRVSKAGERIKVVNLGGSAVGTCIAVPRFFVFEAVPALAELTGLPLARSENLPDATSNIDSLVEAHAILKSHAVNLEKIASDIRLLASDLIGGHEVAIPRRQVGSTIMPGKVNPVITEFVVSACHKVYANDSLIAGLAAQGCLDLNAYLPAIGHALIESVKLLKACDSTMADNLMNGIEISPKRALSALYSSPAISTALIPVIGYHGAERIARAMKENGCDIFEANAKLGVTDQEKLRELLAPSSMLRLGYSIKE